jgi:hypothetical protein
MENYPGYVMRDPQAKVTEEVAYWIAAIIFSPQFIVGAPGGTASGDQDCVMRYYFQNGYPMIGDKHSFYYVQPGTEPIGLQLCKSPIGTGVNDANRNVPKAKPQPRYFDASPGYGNCTEQISPNDAIPPAVHHP